MARFWTARERRIHEDRNQAKALNPFAPEHIRWCRPDSETVRHLKSSATPQIRCARRFRAVACACVISTPQAPCVISTPQALGRTAPARFRLIWPNPKCFQYCAQHAAPTSSDAVSTERRKIWRTNGHRKGALNFPPYAPSRASSEVPLRTGTCLLDPIVIDLEYRKPFIPVFPIRLRLKLTLSEKVVQA